MSYFVHASNGNPDTDQPSFPSATSDTLIVGLDSDGVNSLFAELINRHFEDSLQARVIPSEVNDESLVYENFPSLCASGMVVISPLEGVDYARMSDLLQKAVDRFKLYQLARICGNLSSSYIRFKDSPVQGISWSSFSLNLPKAP